MNRENQSSVNVGSSKHLIWGLVALVFLFVGAAAQAQLAPTNKAPRVLLTWDPNPESDIGGYKIYYGTNSRLYTTVTNVGKTTNAITAGYTRGVRYYWAATAYNTNNLESDFSEEVSLLIPTQPIPVTNLTVNVQ